jgi:hypothetical protein
MRGTLRGVSQYPPPPPYGPPPTNHPQATTILVLGILSLVVCGLLGPFAWSMGSRALREIDASQLTPSPLGGRESVNIGRICGIVGTVLLVLGLAFGLLLVVIGILGSVST